MELKIAIEHISIWYDSLTPDGRLMGVVNFKKNGPPTKEKHMTHLLDTNPL